LLLYEIFLNICNSHNIFERGKNGFIEVSKNLARYRSENNFVGSSK